MANKAKVGKEMEKVQLFSAIIVYHVLSIKLRSITGHCITVAQDQHFKIVEDFMWKIIRKICIVRADVCLYIISNV